MATSKRFTAILINCNSLTETLHVARQADGFTHFGADRLAGADEMRSGCWCGRNSVGAHCKTRNKTDKNE